MATDSLALYRELLLPRIIEERMLVLLRQGKLTKWFSGIGQEAVSVGALAALESNDYVLPMHRNLGVFTSRGVELEPLMCQLLGRQGGFTHGRDRSFHFGSMAHHIVGMISHLGAMLPVACGLGLAARLEGERRVALAFTGDGATSEGDVHEAMNLAAVWRLPVVFIIENNRYGLSTPTEEQYACEQLVDRAVGYGMPGEQVDGNDVLAVRDAVAGAVARARGGEGPSIIECLTFRMRGHEEASGTAYVPDALFAEWAEKDPIARFERVLVTRGEGDESAYADLRSELEERVRGAAERALAAEAPSSTREAELASVYAPTPERERPSPRSTSSMRYVDAISDALRVQMECDPRTILMGQDIAEYGGVFKVTDGFVDRFGRDRVRNTPIVESAAIGAALGLALAGYRPMVELQFADFATCGFNQIANNLAKTRYRWGEAVPVVIRAPQGGGVGAGPFHSQSIEAWFTSIAGLRVVAPATPADAKGLLLSAFADPNPVLFLEHKGLYRRIEAQVPTGDYRVPLGVADLARRGDDATVVTWGVGVHWALDAARVLSEEGIEIEVVDLRTLQPWDVDACLASVRRTSRVLVLHEAPVTGGFGAEVAAVLGKAAFEWLDAPAFRLGALDTPVPFAANLEAIHSPRERVVPTLRRLLAY